MTQPSRAPSPAVLAVVAIGALVLGLLVFWSRKPPADLAEWTPADHDQPAGTPTQGPPPTRPKAQPQEDAAQLTELTWARSCAACHGAHGKGDGPQGPMLRAPDLTRADWQARVSDAEIRQTIQNGRNNMPKFDLPPVVLDGLVKRIRASRAP